VLPGANVSGAAVLGEGALVGANAAVPQQLRVGAGAVIGAGAVATTDVAAGCTVVGVPVRHISPPLPQT
jgi:acetyltransferase-like isoleucine patch superfamily enzyme